MYRPAKAMYRAGNVLHHAATIMYRPAKAMYHG